MDLPLRALGCAALLAGGLLLQERGRPSGRLEHGRYLVERVGLCGQCHTPRDERNALVRERWLEGGPIPVASPFPARPWAARAPALAGLPGLSDAEVIRLLSEGIAHDQAPPEQPMPPYRFTAEDAGAIAAYLRSYRGPPR